MNLVSPRPAFPGEGARLEERLIAHRGVPARHLELSARALAAARDAGAAMIEFDVRPTRDGVLVLHHDRTLSRLFQEARALSELTFEEAREIAESRRGEGSLVSLDEALALTVGHAALDIEVKPDESRGEEFLAREVVRALIRAGTPRDVIVTSESTALLRAMRAAAPTLPTGLVHRSGDERDPVRSAREVAASVIVANAARVDEALAARVAEAGLSLWSYVARDLAHAEELVARGCSALFVDDLPSMREALRRKTGSAARPAGPLLLAIDLGSSSTKVALVSPSEGLVARRSAPTPYAAAEDGRSEIDPDDLLGLVESLLAELARVCDEAPCAAGIASQRSTGLWAHAESGDAMTRALSWRDSRGTQIVAALEARRAELEARAGLPLGPTWTAIRGRVLEENARLAGRRMLVPLGSWIAARLTGAPFDVDPGLANRTFLMRGDGAAWDPELLAAFGYRPDMLPPILPTVHPRGAIAWPGGGSTPLLCLAGDQQCAYVGAAGPTESRLVANLGTGTFVMRLERPGTPLPPGARRAPLWTSTRRPAVRLHLVELALLQDPGEAGPGRSRDDALRAIARALLVDDTSLREQVLRLIDAVERLAQPRDQSLVLTGGGAASPQLVELIRGQSALPVYTAREPETTLLGAARLAAAGARLAWSVPPAGGLDQQSVLPR